MPRFSYGPVAIVSPDPAGGSNDLIRQDAKGGKMYQTNADAVAQVNPLPIFDFAGTPITEITSGPFGQAQWVAEQTRPGGFVNIAGLIVQVWATEVGELLEQAQGAIAQVEAARNVAQQAAADAEQALAALREYISLNPGGGGSGGGGGLPSGTTLDQIPDGADRRAVTTAQLDKLVKAPTTFLQLGTTATTAKPGNYAPTAADVGAVTSMGGRFRIWGGRTTTQGPPTEAEGAVRGTDYAFLDVV